MSESKPKKVIKSALKGSISQIETTVDTVEQSSSKNIQFRIFVGSYEHNLLCLSVILDPTNTKEPVFQPIFHFQAHSLSIKTIDLAKRYLVTGSNDEHIRIYDLQKRKELGTLLSHQGTITALKFSKEVDSTTDSSTSDNLHSGKWLLSGSEDGKIIIWRTKDWEIFATLKGHTKRINDLAIHPSGKVAISVSDDQTIRLWNLLTGKKASVLKLKGKDHLGQSGQFVKWSIDGQYFIVGLLNQILFYKTSNGKIFKKLKFKSTIMSMEILKYNDGKDDIDEWLVIGLGDGSIGFYDFKSIIDSKTEEDEEEKLWDSKPEEIEPIFKLQGHTNRIKNFYFLQSPITDNIPILSSVSSDGKIVIWNLKIRDQVAIYDTGERLNCIVCAPEHIEKLETMKRRIEETPLDVSESEYETDGEEISKIMNGSKKQNKKNKKLKNKNKKRKVNVTLE
ncbi:MAK11 [Candida pseudojiufengensis]|uniref:MAK11 n=1 Tax=Candida pseudojiufengensis TaxID=497109 RepID=UPI002224891C|nr:MAK11 [Candida pseudojiufengensis]KAI5965916.1 MAK11 [Candida pseudojiufengensis]